MVELQRQRTFGVAGIERMQLFGGDQSQNAVTKKFQPLVRCRGVGAGMGERAPEQLAIPEDVAETRFQVSR